MGKHIAVFGGGPVGRVTASLLAARGDHVRLVQRSSPPHLPAGATFHAADVLDPAATKRACEGTEAVVCCVGFKYDARLWAVAWPNAMANLLAACTATEARFVFADNLYMYGPQTAPLREDLPLTTYGKKPRVRADITRLWLEAHQQGKVRAVAVRAADFYGPDAPTSVLSTLGIARLIAGKPALVPYPPDMPHDYTYVPDFARALVSLIDAGDDSYGQAWHVPNAPTRSLRELLVLAADRIGAEARLTVLPRAVSLLVGLFQREVRELQEMRFQWDRPYRVNSSKFAARFWGDATPFADGLDATVAFYRGAPAPKRRGGSESRQPDA